MELIGQYREMHRFGHFMGVPSVVKHKERLKELVSENGAKTMLDYGSGIGKQYIFHLLHHYWNVDVAMYDPAVPLYAKLPEGLFDCVICTDVLEHLEESDVPRVLDEIFGRAKKFVFLTVCTRPAQKLLPDGRNAHTCLKPIDWWRRQIGPRAIPYELVEHD